MMAILPLLRNAKWNVTKRKQTRLARHVSEASYMAHVKTIEAELDLAKTVEEFVATHA